MSSDSTLVITRNFAASQEHLFSMWTDSELVKLWFCPADDMTIPVAEMEVRDGGQYRIVMQNKDGETYSPSGVYESVQPHDKLIFSWKWADSDVVTRVTVDFRAVSPSETELTLTHEGFPDQEMSRMHNEGWDGCLNRLHKYV